jgi:ABC-type transport system involved in cytochrome c biogenesis permease subunit
MAVRWPRGSARLKTIGLILLLVPLGFLALFAVGEVADGDVSGLSHVVQALPLVLLAVVAWRWPLPSGALMVVIGVGIVVVYAIVASSRFGLESIVVVEMILAVPVVSGVLFVMAGLSEGRSGRSRPA